MKSFIFGFILASFFIGSISFANRISQPTRITGFDEKNLVSLNEALENLWDLTNGRFSPNTGRAASTGTGTVKMGSASNANNAGWIKFEKSDGTIIYVPYWSTDNP